ncbi:hypothetical protein OH76DRAFT_273671 [Lentinus brumalis]|uniref:F-box domain-containing protein n=1 Tax=Lentinus brumalis TaxID=2498619 RepID=A0A371DGZ7_9APHY|nr:hypothetical protein OH76DRAFT_273671 [Polyporus brumalis]
MGLPTHLRSLRSLRDVPREIFFEVFALLEAKEDKATLSSCVLVSRLWRNMASGYLWSRITIRTSRPLEDFLEFLQRTSVHREYIHCLTLRGPVSALYEELDPTPDHLLVPQSVTVLHDIVLSLPKLLHLSLQYIDLSSAPEHTLTPSSPSIHLDVLELRHVATDCPNPSPVAPLNLMLRTLPLRSLGELKIASTDEDLPSREPESQDSRNTSCQETRYDGCRQWRCRRVLPETQSMPPPGILAFAFYLRHMR